ncbi:10600_t:CDS:2 [Dentiscutata erythropus]|uniref:10600_t:CDS:1 n=1 Tax=Dentiscutata erythropus TaxID=1348616 RepID=A0A9N9ATM2_9GLOM|nr:10600_t:CDS:2 [Dentiscutata erythropus]
MNLLELVDDVSNTIVQVSSIVQSQSNRDKCTEKGDFFELLYAKKLLDEGIPCIIRKPKGYGDGGIDIQGCYGGKLFYIQIKSTYLNREDIGNFRNVLEQETLEFIAFIFSHKGFNEIIKSNASHSVNFNCRNERLDIHPMNILLVEKVVKHFRNDFNLNSIYPVAKEFNFPILGLDVDKDDRTIGYFGVDLVVIYRKFYFFVCDLINYEYDNIDDIKRHLSDIRGKFFGLSYYAIGLVKYKDIKFRDDNQRMLTTGVNTFTKFLTKAAHIFYKKYFEEYGIKLELIGTSLKVGAIEDNENRKKIAHLLKFPSSYKGSNWTTIDDYISRMKKDQDKMYFVTGSSVEEVEKSPFIEDFVARGYEVLYMVEPIDEMLVQHMPGHGGKMVQNIAKGDINIDPKGFESTAEIKFKFAKLTEVVLADQVEKTQPFKQENEFLKEFYAKQKKILEINPYHPLLLGLLDRVEKGQTDETSKELVQVLYESTLIRSGYDLKDNLKILRKNLGIDLNAKPEINIVPAEDADLTEKKSSELKKHENLFKEFDRDEPSVKPSTDADDDSTDPTKPSYKHDEL